VIDAFCSVVMVTAVGRCHLDPALLGKHVARVISHHPDPFVATTVPCVAVVVILISADIVLAVGFETVVVVEDCHSALFSGESLIGTAVASFPHPGCGFGFFRLSRVLF
jgi:hypothetical protein